MNAAIRLQSAWVAAVLFLAVLATASTGRAWNEDTHQSLVEFSYQVINLVDHEKNRRDPNDPNTAVFPEILNAPAGVNAAEWEQFLTVVGASRGRLGELVIGAEREELDEHAGNILCAPPVARRLKTIDEYPFGLIAANAKKFNEDPAQLPPCQKLNPGEFQFGGIYNNRQLDLASGNGPRTGSMLGWLSAGVDSRIDDWVPVFVPLEAALNFFAGLLTAGDPDGSAEQLGGGVLLVLAIVLLFALAAAFLGPIGGLLTAGLLLASFFEYNLTDFVTTPRDHSGLAHFINVQEQVTVDFVFPPFVNTTVKIPSNQHDDRQGKALEQAFFMRGSQINNAVQDSFDHYLLDVARLGPTIDFDESFGPRHYQITDPDDGDQPSTPFRGEEYWDDHDMSEIAYPPVDNLGYYGWRKWRDDSCKKVENLHWPLHAIGDAAAPHHVVGVTGFGHRPFEDIVQFSNAAGTGTPLTISPQWNEIIHEGNAAEGRAQARRILQKAFELSRVIRSFQQTHPGDVPVRQLVTRVAQDALALLHAPDAAKISCSPNACRVNFRPIGTGGAGGGSGSADAGADAGDAGPPEQPDFIICDGTCSGIAVKPSCKVVFTDDAQQCTVNEFIALELSNTSGAIPAVFPPGLSHYYDGHFTNQGRGYYRQPALVNEQRKFIELGVGATLAFLAYAAELVSAPVSEEDCLCDDPLVRCSGECRDLNTDNQNCGACGVACFAGTACCNGQCVDVMQNDRNCGRCGRACSVLTNCTNGICACPNPAHAACPDLCTDIKTDPSNCGFCGRRCGQFGTCNDGRCSVPGPD